MSSRFFYFFIYYILSLFPFVLFSSQNASDNFQPTGLYFSFHGGYIFAAEEYSLTLREYIEDNIAIVKYTTSTSLREQETKLAMVYDVSSGKSVSGSLGYDFFNGISLEAEWMYMVKEDFDNNAQFVFSKEFEKDVGYVLESYFTGLIFKSKFYWDTRYNLLPFFSVGSGIVDISTFLNFDSLKIISSKRSSIVGEAGLGFGVLITKNTMISLGYNYMFFPTANLEYLKPDYYDEEFIPEDSGSVVQYDLNNIRHRLSKATFEVKIFF